MIGFSLHSFCIYLSWQIVEMWDIIFRVPCWSVQCPRPFWSVGRKCTIMPTCFESEGCVCMNCVVIFVNRVIRWTWTPDCGLMCKHPSSTLLFVKERIDFLTRLHISTSVFQSHLSLLFLNSPAYTQKYPSLPAKHSLASSPPAINSRPPWRYVDATIASMLRMPSTCQIQ